MVYGEWLQSAVAQYQAEFAEMSRISQSLGTEAASIVHEKIEVASRELHAKLLLTYFAVDRGYEVVIGWKRMTSCTCSTGTPRNRSPRRCSAALRS